MSRAAAPVPADWLDPSHHTVSASAGGETAFSRTKAWLSSRESAMMSVTRGPGGGVIRCGSSCSTFVGSFDHMLVGEWIAMWSVERCLVRLVERAWRARQPAGLDRGKVRRRAIALSDLMFRRSFAVSELE